jgi:hypothetical protein
MVGFDVAGMAKPNDEVSLPVVGMMAVRFTASLAILAMRRPCDVAPFDSLADEGARAVTLRNGMIRVDERPSDARGMLRLKITFASLRAEAKSVIAQRICLFRHEPVPAIRALNLAGHAAPRLALTTALEMLRIILLRHSDRYFFREWSANCIAL